MSQSQRLMSKFGRESCDCGTLPIQQASNLTFKNLSSFEQKYRIFACPTLNRKYFLQADDAVPSLPPQGLRACDASFDTRQRLAQ